jgi:hypothetical protein
LLICGIIDEVVLVHYAYLVSSTNCLAMVDLYVFLCHHFFNSKPNAAEFNDIAFFYFEAILKIFNRLAPILDLVSLGHPFRFLICKSDNNPGLICVLKLFVYLAIIIEQGLRVV